mgnify:CR=1 FL=1
MVGGRISRRARSLKKYSKRTIKKGGKRIKKRSVRKRRHMGGMFWKKKWEDSADKHNQVYKKIEQRIKAIPEQYMRGEDYNSHEILEQFLKIPKDNVIEEIKKIKCEATKDNMINCRELIPKFIKEYVDNVPQKLVSYNRGPFFHSYFPFCKDAAAAFKPVPNLQAHFFFWHGWDRVQQEATPFYFISVKYNTTTLCIHLVFQQDKGWGFLYSDGIYDTGKQTLREFGEHLEEGRLHFYFPDIPSHYSAHGISGK